LVPWNFTAKPGVSGSLNHRQEHADQVFAKAKLGIDEIRGTALDIDHLSGHRRNVVDRYHARDVCDEVRANGAVFERLPDTLAGLYPDGPLQATAGVPRDDALADAEEFVDLPLSPSRAALGQHRANRLEKASATSVRSSAGSQAELRRNRRTPPEKLKGCAASVKWCPPSVRFKRVFVDTETA
jgi:hypothetical protein